MLKTHRKWWILALLFLATVINYVDRQTLSVLARAIQSDLRLSEMDYAGVVQAFLLAYTLAYLVVGRVTDRLGTRWSMVLFLGWWSLANMLTGLVSGLRSLGLSRFLLGLGEAGNYTVAPKAVGEWFAERDRGFAIGIYTAGAMVGATIAPPMIAWLGGTYGWRWAFIGTGSLGLLWLIPWLGIYRRGPFVSTAAPVTERALWRSVLSDRRVWLLVTARLLSDPVWYFYLFWFPKYLIDGRHLALAEVGRTVWVVYLAADLGSVLGGASSGRLIQRGLPVMPARLRVMTIAALLAPLGCLIAADVPVPMVLALGALVSFSHLTWQVTMGAMVVDLYPPQTLATAFGLIAAGSGLGGMLSTGAIGWLVTHFSYRPVFVLLALLHPLALLAVGRVRKKAPGNIQAI